MNRSGNGKELKSSSCSAIFDSILSLEDFLDRSKKILGDIITIGRNDYRWLTRIFCYLFGNRFTSVIQCHSNKHMHDLRDFYVDRANWHYTILGDTVFGKIIIAAFWGPR